MQKLLEKWKMASEWASAKGIPLPLFRNPKHQEASVTFTMLVVSYIICVLGATDMFDGVSFEHSFELFMAVSALYFGRNFQKNKISSSKPENKSEQT